MRIFFLFLIIFLSGCYNRETNDDVLISKNKDQKILLQKLNFINTKVVVEDVSKKKENDKVSLDIKEKENYFINSLVILAAISFALFSVLSKKIKIEAYTLTTIYFLTATIISFISMLLFSNFSLPTRSTIVPILLNGVLVNGYSYIFWIEALKKAPASFVAPFIFLSPVLAAVYLICFFGEPFLFVYLLGLVFVIAGGLLNQNKIFKK